MNQRVIVGAFLALASLCLQEVSLAHGGVYRRPYGGPGDTVPPREGGAAIGGSPATGPAGPHGASPTAPPVAGPAGPAAPIGGARGGVSTGCASSSGTDLTSWELWWNFNKDQYLNVKAVVHQLVLTGSDEFFICQRHPPHTKDVLKPSEEAIRSKIVPALEEALEKERSNDIVTGALVALAKIGDAAHEDGGSKFEAIIGRFLSDSNQEIAETAACALGILANDSSIRTLETLLHDEPDGRKRIHSGEVPLRTRAFAAYGLGLIGNRTQDDSLRQTIARTLVKALQKPDMSTKDVKVAALVALGLVPVELDRRENPAGASEPWTSRESEIRFIVHLFEADNGDSFVRAHAPAALARLLDGCSNDLKESTTKLLIEALGKFSKERGEVRQGCALALGQIGDCDQDKVDVEIRKTLERIVDDGDQQSRSFALVSLGQIGGRPGAGAEADAGARDTRAFLLSTMTKGKCRLRPWAALGIGIMERSILDGARVQSSVAKAELRTALEQCENPSDLGAYAIALGICKDSEAEVSLRQKLDEVSDKRARGYVAVALGLVEARDATEPIHSIVRESKFNPELLQQAAIGLGLLGDRELVPELVAMLEESKSLASQGAIASALGFIGDSRSIDPLVKLLQKAERTGRARGLAAVALGIVADRQPLPWNSKISTNLNYRASTSTLTSEESTGILDML